MASPKVHAKASGLLLVMYVVGFFIGFTFDWLDILWIVVFGILIDADHIPFGRLWQAFKFGGFIGVKKSWFKYGWFDADHLNIMHTWTALVAVTFFSYEMSNPWPLVSFAIHMLIDGFSASAQDYPKCSPLTRDIGRLIIRLGMKRFMYHTEGVPSPKR